MKLKGKVGDTEEDHETFQEEQTEFRSQHFLNTRPILAATLTRSEGSVWD
jgi:hypothetical protein